MACMSDILYPYAVLDGEIVLTESLTLPVTSPTAQYGIGLFEGIMAYPAPGGVRVIALREHLERMWSSAEKTPFKLVPPITVEAAIEAMGELCRKNAADGRAYIRPCFYHEGTGDIRLGPALAGKTRFAGYIQRWDFWLPPGRGMRCTISPFKKAIGSLSRVKVCGNYAGATEAKFEALARGFDEAILFDTEDHVAEGTTENLILEWKGKLIEPDYEGAPILPGITSRIVRETIAPSLGERIEPMRVTKEMLFEADGLLLTGTAAEVTHASELDGYLYNGGEATPRLAALTKGYQDIIEGRSFAERTTVEAETWAFPG